MKGREESSMNRIKVTIALGKAALALALSLAAGAAAFAAPASAVDSLGRKVELRAPARRIVSLSPEATEALYAVGAGPAMVGDTSYCDYPAEAKGLAKIGGFSSDTISVEKIVSLRPDLVVTAGALHQPVEAALAKLGIPFYAYLPSSFAQIEESMAALGVLAGDAAKGRAAAAALEASLAKVRALTAALPESKRPTVFWQVYDEPLMTCGANSFPHQVLELAGGRDIFAEIPGPWPVVSAEEVLRRAPQFILSPDDMGDKVDAAKLAARPGWAAIPAVRDKRIALLKADLVSRAGPRIADGVLAALRALHPELLP
jgi:iron complex transport system substrate-binding protein